MATVEQVQAMGAYIRQRRKAKEWRLWQLEEASGVAEAYLSNIENGYVNPRRGPVVPSDDILEAIAHALDFHVEELHARLGRMPDFAFLTDPDGVRMAELYSGASPQGRAIIRHMVEDAARLAASLEQGSIVPSRAIESEHASVDVRRKQTPIPHRKVSLEKREIKSG